MLAVYAGWVLYHTLTQTTAMAAQDVSRFAGAVVLGDLNDFVAPSQACVNPIIASDIATANETLDAESMLGLAKISLESSIFSGLPYVPRFDSVTILD